MELSQADLSQLDKKNISLSQVEQQVTNFKNGFPFVKLTAPAILNHGITQLNEENLQKLTAHYDQVSPTLHITKFTPASGAASRMFKDLYDFIDAPSENHKIISTLQNWKNFAFASAIKENVNPQDNSLNTYTRIAQYIVSEQGLNYGNSPKGLIQFHQYNTESRTAFEEHLVEGGLYCKGKNETAHLHFTVSPEHEEKIKTLINKVQAQYEKGLQTKFNLSFSQQESNTDTLAVDENNEPFREDDGSLLFRPGGHGALIQNLNNIDSDIIFIKNIDNVVPDHLKDITIRYKKALGAFALKTQASIHKLLNELSQNIRNEELINEIASITQLSLHSLSNEALFTALNKPLRVCGMVKNEGEPGGGPFWVENEEKQLSLQIIESAQIDPANEAQQSILQNSTHFNPVDLVCCIRNYEGKKHDLNQFIDHNTGFISYKSKNGKELKAMELPGLWNGAMAHWISVFVEVPVITFNPVKTISDLLRATHQKPATQKV